jgi:hypothetical protein
MCGVVRGDIDTRADAVDDTGIESAHRPSADAKPVGSATD